MTTQADMIPDPSIETVLNYGILLESAIPSTSVLVSKRLLARASSYGVSFYFSAPVLGTFYVHHVDLKGVARLLQTIPYTTPDVTSSVTIPYARESFVSFAPSTTSVRNVYIEASSFVGPQGLVGAQGPAGQVASAQEYRADTNITTLPPANGRIVWNNLTQTAATVISFSHLTYVGYDIDLILAAVPSGSRIVIQDLANSTNSQTWVVNGTPTVVPNSYVSFPVTLASGSFSFSDNHHALVLFQSPSAGSGSKTLSTFTPNGNQPPAAGFATPDTRNSISVLDFDEAATESAIWVGLIPEGSVLSSGVKVRIHWMATSATTGNVRWSAAIQRMDTDLDTDSFDAAAAVTSTANGTSGVLTVAEINLSTIDSVGAGDPFRLRVQRLGADAADTMTGDAELVCVELRNAS